MSTTASIPPSDQIHASFGVIFNGYSVSFIGYGFTFYRTSSHSSPSTQRRRYSVRMISLIVLTSCAKPCPVSEAVYFYVVSSLPYFGGLVFVTPKFNVALLLSVITVVVAQWVYAAHLWQMRKSVLSCAIGATSTAALSLGITMVSLSMKQPTFAHWSVPHMKIIISLTHTFVFVATALIFGAMAVSRTERQTPFESSRRLEPAQHLLTHSISHGGLGAALQLACLITFVSRPHKLLWLPFYLVGTKVFINGLIYMYVPRPTTEWLTLTLTPAPSSHRVNSREIPRPGGGSTATSTAAQIGTATTGSVMFSTTRTVDISPAIRRDEDGVYAHSKGAFAAQDRGDAFGDVINAHKD
ncbi:hypothetical protein GGX14DRAFT_573450 [Mycena pura]|uniref:Uncharacterized protein n=1 Tax=Mycena pura TaxID=153505 RepID=A0AAD6Y2Y0_9AGAR|nr:hypothetical protein GGX14DRAFT_573450 [Mycena pura]